MDISTFLNLADDYLALGASVQRQLADFLNGKVVEDLDPEGLRLAAKFLRKTGGEISDAMDFAEEITAALACQRER